MSTTIDEPDDLPVSADNGSPAATGSRSPRIVSISLPRPPTITSGFTSTSIASAPKAPFGGPITHGYLTLSLLSDMVARILDVRGARRL